MAIELAHAKHRVRHRRTGRLLPALLLATVLAMTGCGGSSKDTPTTSAAASAANSTPATTPTVTRDTSPSSMIATAETICRRLNTEVATHSTTIKSLTAIARTADHLAHLEQSALGELAKLKAPATLSHEWQLIIADRQKLANNLIDLSRDAQHKEITKFDSIGASNNTIEHELLATGKRAGLNYCSHVG